MLDAWRDDDSFSANELDAIERRTREVGDYLLEHLDQRGTHPLQRRWWDDRIMEWAMRDEQVKVELFRFVDVLPMLSSSEAICSHLFEYLGRVRHRLPRVAGAALGIAQRNSVTRAAVARAARLSAMDLARRFIAGTNTGEVLDAARRERDQDRGFTLDILGEAVISDWEAERFFEAYVNLIEELAPRVNSWPENPLIDRGVMGPLPRMNLSIKLSALEAQFDPIDRGRVLADCGERFRELLRVARRHGAFVNVDMESYDKKDLTIWIFQQVLMEDEFRDVGDVGIVIQCYLRDAARDLRDLSQWAAKRGKPIWVRLVKGAYWDYEVAHAQSLGWEVPVYRQKWQSDASFEQATRFVMRQHELLRPALGTHNVRSMAHGIAVAEHLGLPTQGFEIQMLYGMADLEKQALQSLGHRLRIYMPHGELIPGMAYLVRRLLENTSNDSFLRAASRVDADQLLRNPLSHEHDPPQVSADESEHRMADRSQAFEATFSNQPPVDFAREANRTAMRSALEEVRAALGGSCGPIIDGQQRDTQEMMRCLDPSDTALVVGFCGLAQPGDVTAAVDVARRGLPAWSSRGAASRAEVLRRAAEIMRDELFELAAWEVYECGKGWREATNDICEAIDFCEFYAAGAIELERPRGADVPGEENRFEYLPRGVTAVIAPWNFPLAILTGMTAAALATGNTVVMKPAEQASLVADQLWKVFSRAGLPAEVLQLLPGRGETVGTQLVDHPEVALIAFTGSRTVGLQINARAAAVSVDSHSIVKRVIAEMGGKNAIVVDSDADLDEAVTGVVASAFGFQGQKCSACSRVIVLDEIHDVFLKRLVEAAKALRVGPASDPGTDVGPVIDAEAEGKIRRFIADARQVCRQELAVEPSPEIAGRGYFVGPHIFSAVTPEMPLAQEEIFGPVLAVIRAADLEHAFQIANGTEYALTAGFYSRSPANLERARRELRVGNLYLNRSITGALVGRQPFGGFKMSGIGSKAGGDDYLLQFVVPRTVTENTMRRGFAPGTE